MSFQITEPGFYEQKNGGKAEVFAERNGWWYGHEESGISRRWRGTGASSACDRDYDIVGPWHEPPQIDPGEGWRMMEIGEVVEDGDESLENGRWVKRRFFGAAITRTHLPHRRRITKPFTISEHGPGIYETRDGREESVRWNDSGTLWGREEYDFRWYDTGRTQSEKETPRDLVRYIGPLPNEQPWVPTNELRWKRPATGWSTTTIAMSALVNVLEQKWVRGTESEWRPVEVEQ